MQQQPWGRWLTTTTTTTTTTLQNKTHTETATPGRPHPQRQTTDTAPLEGLGKPWSVLSSEIAVRPESKRPPILDEAATPYQPIDASKSWWSRRFALGGENSSWWFWFRWPPKWWWNTQTDFNLTPTKTFNISRILGLLILYARHRIISKKLATSNESAPESNESNRGHGGWFWWRETMEDVETMCPTETWMCIKLLVGYGYISQNHRWSYTHQKKILYVNAACSNTKKKNLYWDIG